MKVVNEETLELEEIDNNVTNDEATLSLSNKIKTTLDCDPKEISDKYMAYKKAEEEFNTVYEPFKEKLIKLMKEDKEVATLAKTIILGDISVTYVEPSTRNSIDTKKLKEERPDIAKEFNKTTSVDATLRVKRYT